MNQFVNFNSTNGLRMMNDLSFKILSKIHFKFHFFQKKSGEVIKK